MTRQKFPNIRELLSGGCVLLDIPVSDSAISKMIIYLELLMYWNTKVNLTSISDPEAIAVAHFLDSLTVFKVWPLNSKAHILDLGSGAGFPGLVLKIVDDSLSVTLVDKNPKRIVFLKMLAKELGLSSISFVNLEFKEFFKNFSSQKFDVVSFRALPKKTLKFLDIGKVLRPSGYLIKMFSKLPKNHLTHIENYKEVQCWTGVLPYLGLDRSVVLYQAGDQL